MLGCVSHLERVLEDGDELLDLIVEEHTGGDAPLGGQSLEKVDPLHRETPMLVVLSVVRGLFSKLSRHAAPVLEKLTSVHSRSWGRSTGRMSCVNGIGNWYFATKSKAHCESRSLTCERIPSCS